MNRDLDFTLFFGAVLLIMLIVGLVSWQSASDRDDCTLICRTHGSEMADVTRYGCLCADGSLTAEPAHSTTVPVVVPVSR